MTKNEEKIINSFSGFNKQIICEMIDDNAIENISNSDYPQYLKNGLLIFHLALKTLTYKAVESVSFSLSHVFTGEYDFNLKAHKDIQKAQISGQICFTNRANLMDYNKPITSPSNADRRFKGFGHNTYSEFTKKLEKNIISLPEIDFNGEIPEEYCTLSFNFRENNFQKSFIETLEKNPYFFSSLLNVKLNEKMNSITQEFKNEVNHSNFKI